MEKNDINDKNIIKEVKEKLGMVLVRYFRNQENTENPDEIYTKKE